MTDIVDSQTRSRMMSGIRGQNTKPELALRRSLHALGLRYRLHAKGIPGKPDIVMPKYRAVIFVHGCFWHRHAGCRYATVPATRPEFWAAKFDANVVRDAAVQSALREAGWRVGTVWECALRTETAIAQTRTWWWRGFIAATLYLMWVRWTFELGHAQILIMRRDRRSGICVAYTG